MLLHLDMVALTVQIGRNILPGARLGQPDGDVMTALGPPQPELEPDQRLGATPGGQVETFHGDSIRQVAAIMAVIRA